TVAVELDPVDAPDRLPADQNLVALHQLPPRLEQQPVLVAVASRGEQEIDDGDDDERQRPERRDARESPSPAALRRRRSGGRAHPRLARGQRLFKFFRLRAFLSGHTTPTATSPNLRLRSYPSRPRSTCVFPRITGR